MPLEIRLKKEPHRQQQIAIELDNPEQLYGGAKRGGKSVWLCQKAFMLNVMFPGNRGLMCRYNFTDLQDTTLAEFFEVVPSDMILNHHLGQRTIILRTTDPRCERRGANIGTKDGFSPWASRQLYRGLGDPEDFEKVKGLSIGHLEIDEPSEVPFDQYLMLRAQLTWSLPDGKMPPYMVLLASNPEPGWVEDRFITSPQPGCIFVPSLPRDNPHLPAGYEADLRASYPAEWVTKYLDGAWGSSEGAVFKELDERTHNLDNWVDPRDERKYYEWAWPLNLVLSIDHASTGYVAMVLMGVDFFGNLYAIAEYYQKDKLISDHCFGMREVLDPFLTRDTGSGGYLTKQLMYRLIDPSTTQRTQQGQQQLQAVADDYRENGFPCVPAWNALELGIGRIKEYLHPIPMHRHPFTGVYGSPGLFISQYRCPHLWAEMRALKKKVRSNGYIEYVGRDHAIDDIRYIILSRPRRPELERIDELGLNSTDLMAKRSHEKWARKFAMGQGSSQGTWYEGMGLN